jgi:hypothetical protein
MHIKVSLSLVFFSLVSFLLRLATLRYYHYPHDPSPRRDFFLVFFIIPPVRPWNHC